MKINPKNVHRTLARHMLADGFEIVCDLKKSRGVWLCDAKDGRKYLDMFAFFSTLPLGLNHPDLAEPGFVNKLGRAGVNKITNSDVYSVEMAEAVDAFSRIAIPNYLPHLFFIDGGTLAVENALKTAFDWKVRKNFARGVKTEKGTKVIHFRHSFHGRSGYSLSMTNTADPRKYQYFPKFDWPRIEPPTLKFPLTDKHIREVKEAESKAADSIHKAIRENEGDIAALIIEPIQAEGGDNHFRPEFLGVLRTICDENEALLIFDEVQTGFGITGKMWAHEHFGVRPDVLAFGKRSQVCGILAGKRIDEVELNVFVEHSRINSTWGGNLVDMVRAARILEVIRRDRLLQRAARAGAHLLSGLKKLEREIGEATNARGLGLMCAIDLPSSEERNRVRLACFKRGMIILPCGERSLRFRPAMTVTEKEIDLAIGILGDSIRGHSRKSEAYDQRP